MYTQSLDQAARDYQRVEQAIVFLEQNFHRQPSLGEVARSVYLSEYHFQRLFTRWVGISPKRFLQFLTKEYAKELLKESRNLLEVTYETGLSSPGRLHDLFVNCEAVTPGEFQRQGAGLTLEYGIHPTPFGECLLATTERGICWFSFVKDGGAAREISALRAAWPNAQLQENRLKTGELVFRIFNPEGAGELQELRVLLKGTNFQIKVWEALLRIPSGQVLAYEDVARLIGRPRAVRAVANAVARNPVGVIIPCHRVIRKVGDFGEYGGGRTRKIALLAWEAARRSQEELHTVSQ